MARQRKFGSAAALEKAWLEYKESCDKKTVVTTAFSPKHGCFVTQEIPHPITYTIKGFCAYAGLTEAAFYDLYNKEAKLEPVIARMKQDCEIDAREKFENGTLDSRLAGLWMSNYGYTTKTDASVSNSVDVTIVDDLGDDDA